MALNLATFNAWGLREPNKYLRLLDELSNLSVNVAAVRKTHFTCTANCRVLSAYCSRSSVGVSLLIGRSLNSYVNLVLADDRGRLVVADVAIKSFVFWVTAVYAPNIAAERVSFFRWLAPFLDNPKWIVLVSDWNLKIGSEWELRGSGGCESSLIDFTDRHDLVDRFCLDHSGREMWTWLDRPLSVLDPIWTE